MSSTGKQAQEPESQNEQYFKVTGRCIRVKNGQMQCDLQTVDSEPVVDEDFLEGEELASDIQHVHEVSPSAKDSESESEEV